MESRPPPRKHERAAPRGTALSLDQWVSRASLDAPRLFQPHRRRPTSRGLDLGRPRRPPSVVEALVAVVVEPNPAPVVEPERAHPAPAAHVHHLDDARVAVTELALVERIEPVVVVRIVVAVHHHGTAVVVVLVHD